jgi:hypothetical protein
MQPDKISTVIELSKPRFEEEELPIRVLQLEEDTLGPHHKGPECGHVQDAQLL